MREERHNQPGDVVMEPVRLSSHSEGNIRMD